MIKKRVAGSMFSYFGPKIAETILLLIILYSPSSCKETSDEIDGS